MRKRKLALQWKWMKDLNRQSIEENQPRLDAWDKRSDLVQWENLEGAGGEGGGRGDRNGEHMQTHGCFISMYDKIHYKFKK